MDNYCTVCFLCSTLGCLFAIQATVKTIDRIGRGHSSQKNNETNSNPKTQQEIDSSFYHHY